MPDRLCLACGEMIPPGVEHDCEEAKKRTKRHLRDMRDAARGEFRTE